VDSYLHTNAANTVTARPFDTNRWKGVVGYDPGFLGVSVPMPLPRDLADVQLTTDGDPTLDYTHFSVVMSASRRLAHVAAVNMDGARYVDIVRDSDEWRLDPRIPVEAQVDNDAYVSNDYDRGHLVRRVSPNWGTAAEADQANDDTFHYTNAAPQHKDLNRKTWLDLESYILEQAIDRGLRVSIFTGPVFRPDDTVYRQDFQIPADYWKVAVAADGDHLTGAAYLQTQRNLIPTVSASPYGDYKTYRVPISMVAQLTGLDLGPIQTIEPIQGTGAMRQAVTEVTDVGDVSFLT
jgi:endonuclease G